MPFPARDGAAGLLGGTCAPCRAVELRLERFTLGSPGAFRVYRIDVVALRELTGRFDVMSIRTLALLHDGKKSIRLDGSCPLPTGRSLMRAFSVRVCGWVPETDPARHRRGCSGP